MRILIEYKSNRDRIEESKLYSPVIIIDLLTLSCSQIRINIHIPRRYLAFTVIKRSIKG